ncbi:transcriptional regulator [Pandoraea communis]|uniref:Transcriptional regulator n=1 Tax=Pandoraea communis TaxID=2508297 RepID=A0A5E4XZH0_9BURK|nr:helix-turn-helix transcriptional regulator [Pandoraea communis]VVE41687.1 transcriptional regulator [Pandoraea communis]
MKDLNNFILVQENWTCNAPVQIFMTFGERLKEERSRLGYTQSAFGNLVGVSKQTQSNYESGYSEPKLDFWPAAAQVGVDVLYVLLGKRDAATLLPDEQDLLRRYNAASDAVKAAALGALIGGTAPAKVQQNFHSGVNIGQQIAGDVKVPQTFTFGSTKKKK